MGGRRAPARRTRTVARRVHPRDVTETLPRDDARDIALLLRSAADVHEGEGRAALARSHRRAAGRLGVDGPLEA